MKKCALSLWVLLMVATQSFTLHASEFEKSQKAEITLTKLHIDFGEVFQGTLLTKRNIIVNTGNEDLVLGSLSSDNTDFIVFYSDGDTTGGFVVPPGDSTDIFIQFNANNLGTSSASITITSSTPSISFSVSATGITPPSSSFSPDTLDEVMYSGDLLEREIILSNSEGAPLEYSIILQFGQQVNNTESTPVFSGVGPMQTSKTIKSKIEQKDTYIEKKSLTSNPELLLNSIAQKPELNELLKSVQESLSSIANLIQNRYDFSGGESGNSISDGGGDMYDDGNYIRYENSYIPYSDLTITSDFQSESSVNYFTAKKTGLFTFIGDFTNANRFYIDGWLGADGEGAVKGNYFEISISGRAFSVFTKQVYNAGDPSVNHIIIVENGTNLSRSFSTSTDDDFHQINNLPNDARIFYVLFAGQNGKEFSESEMLMIAQAYLDMFEFVPPFITIPDEYFSGSVESGDQLSIPVTINTAGLVDSTYLADIVFSTNDPYQASKKIPIRLEVTSAAGINVAKDSLNFGSLFVGDSTSQKITLRNSGSENLIVTNLIFESLNFSVSSSISFPIVVEPYQEHELTLFFNPSEIGAAYDSVKIINNDPSNPEFNIFLTGIGVDPPVASISPAELSFTLAAGDSMNGNISISNLGGSDLYYEIEVLNKDGKDQLEPYKPSIFLSTTGLDQASNFNEYPLFVEYFFNEERFDTVFAIRNESNSIENFTVSDSLLYVHHPYETRIAVYNINEQTLVKEFDIANDSYISGMEYSGKYLYATVKNYITNRSYLFAIDVESETIIDTVFTTDRFDIFAAINSKEDRFYQLNQSNANVDIYSLSTGEFQRSIFNNIESTFHFTYSPASNLLYTYDYIHELGGSYLLAHDPLSETIIDTVDIPITDIYGIAANIESNPLFLRLNSPTKDSVADGLSRTIDFTINTDQLNGGDYSSIFSIETNDPSNPLVEIPLELRVIGTPELSINADTLFFGKNLASRTFYKSVELSNTGSENVIITEFVFDSDEFSITRTDMDLVIEPRNRINIQVAFHTPDSAAIINGTLTMQTNVGDITVYLNGESVTGPILGYDFQHFEVELMQGDTTSIELNLRNIGDDELFLSVYPEGGLSSDTAQILTKANSSNNLSILLIQDRYAWDINPSTIIGNKFGEENLTVINSGQLARTSFDTYDLVITSGGQKDSYYFTLSENENKFTDYITNGGTVLYSIATFNADVLLAGSVNAVHDVEFHLHINNFDHPLTEGLANFDLQSTGNHQVLNELPTFADIIFVAAQSQQPAFTEYRIGSGKVIASGVPMEYHHNRRSTGSKFQDFYVRVLDYAYEAAQNSTPWITFPQNDFYLSSESNNRVVRPIIDTQNLEVGEYSAHLFGYSNIGDQRTKTSFANISLTVTAQTSIDEADGVPQKTELSQNYPNPFNPSTNIRYTLSSSSNVELRVFNILGQEVLNLVNEQKPAGIYTQVFNASQLSSGVYFYKLIVNGEVIDTKQMLLIK
jgi:hypothetical protein